MCGNQFTSSPHWSSACYKFYLPLWLAFLASSVLACPGGDCPDGKCPLSKKLDLDPERAAKLNALETKFKQDREAMQAEHHAKLAEILTLKSWLNWKRLTAIMATTANMTPWVMNRKNATKRIKSPPLKIPTVSQHAAEALRDKLRWRRG